MHNHLPLILLLLTFTISCDASPQPYKTLVAPINKDTTTSLYTITLNSHEHYLIDINSPVLWFVCNRPHYPIPCNSPQCRQGRSYLSPLCSSSNNAVKHGQCTCMVTLVNPVTESCALSQLTTKNLGISWTNGRNPTTSINFNPLYASCAPVSLLRSLPKNAIGVAGLSWAPLALSAQFTSPSSLGISKKFAVCLPSVPSASGVIFFGDGPYNLMPPTLFDAAGILSYTPLIKRSNSQEFYIGVKGISIGGKASSFRPGTFGGVKLSTASPYTTLRSDIYRIFLNDFSLAMKNIPRVKKVNLFELCFKASAIGFSRVGLHVPQVDLELGNGKNWTIFGANSMKQLGSDVACLAFVDGGKTAKEAVVVGSYQMEDNFLLFDLAASRLGFSSSLLFFRTTCGNFNFTSSA